jgi:hypothetical protein
MSDYNLKDYDRVEAPLDRLCRGCAFNIREECTVSNNGDFECWDEGREYIFIRKEELGTKWATGGMIDANTKYTGNLSGKLPFSAGVVLTDEMAESITGQKSCLDPSAKVSVEDALEALESMDDFARMDIGVTPIGPYSVLHKFIDQVVREREEAAAKVARVTTLESRSNVSDH